jgi:AcrR family transcriptional regulator
LLTRQIIIDTAIRIIDAEGLAAFSTRRLARELRINQASLYHHFRSKDEILDGIRFEVLREVRVPGYGQKPWPEWIVAACVATRSALLAHPNIAPLVYREITDITTFEVRNEGAALLVKQGVPLRLVAALISSFDSLAFGSAVLDPTGAGSIPRDKVNAAAFPDIAAMLDANPLPGDEMFELQCRTLAKGWLAVIAAEEDSEAWPAL